MKTRYSTDSNFDNNHYTHCLVQEINSHWGFEAHLLNLFQIEVTKNTYTFVIDIAFEGYLMSLKVKENLGSATLNMFSELLMNIVSPQYYGKTGRQTYKRYKTEEKLESIISSFTEKYMH